MNDKANISLDNKNIDTILVLALKAGVDVAKREIKDYLLFGHIGQKQ